MCDIACATKAGWRVRSNASSADVTGSVSRNCNAPKIRNAPTATAKLQRHAISANPSDGRRKIARKPSSVGEYGFMFLSNYDVNQPAKHYDFLNDLLASNRRLDLFICKSLFEHGVFGCIWGHDNPATQFAVDLHRYFNLLFFRQFRHILRPA